MEDQENQEVKDVEIPEEEDFSALDKFKNFNPCGGNPSDYNNPTAGIAISAGATALIGAGMPGIYARDPWGIVLVLIGIIVYFVKAYLMKKNCL